MAPKRKKREEPQLLPPSADPDGIFSGMIVFLVEDAVQPRRLQIWKQRLIQLGAAMESDMSKGVTHVFAINSDALLRRLSKQRLARYKGSILLYQWLEETLRSGGKVNEETYDLRKDLENANTSQKSSDPKVTTKTASREEEKLQGDRISSPRENSKHDRQNDARNSPNQSDYSSESLRRSYSSHASPNVIDREVSSQASSLIYSPPDLNRDITEIFGKLINIYRALGEERRSFSYYKAIPVIEKLPFRIESMEQVKNLPTIGKSMQEHIQEIVTTGKLSKLEHFESDEKVCTISLFGEIWGIGPATALKLYEKGYRTLDDLKNESSLTHAQKIGLQYFDDIKQRIPRREVEEMEKLLQKTGEEVLPGLQAKRNMKEDTEESILFWDDSLIQILQNFIDFKIIGLKKFLTRPCMPFKVVVVCGGSYRRGKSSCGDMDVVISHPDGRSHKGFLKKYVKHLKDMGFLQEDLVFSTHSEEGTDSGVDTYFGLCTYPGRELRHRIDLKVYPREIYAFGLIAWTGNDVLNRRLRLLAETKGFRLDDTGLFPVTHSSDGKRGFKGSASIKLNTEKDVFHYLGFPWLEPHERNL